jgi:hypothetical protein
MQALYSFQGATAGVQSKVADYRAPVVSEIQPALSYNGLNSALRSFVTCLYPTL